MDYLEKAEMSARSQQWEAAMAFACIDIAKTLRDFMVVEIVETEDEPHIVPIRNGHNDD